MKKISIISILIVLFSMHLLAENTTVHITVKNFKGSVDFYNPEFRYDLNKKKIITLHFDAQGSATFSMDISNPTFVILYFLSDKFFNYSLFLSPGDELFLTTDFAKKSNGIIVTGKGSNNNQPEIFALTNMDVRPFKQGMTPDRIIASINMRNKFNKLLLTNYIKVNKPSAALIKNAQINLQYFAPVTYYEFYHNNAFNKSPNQLRKWQKVQDSLFSTIKLTNNEALGAFNYSHLIDNFTQRETENLTMQCYSNPMLFYKQWFNSDSVRAKKLLNDARAGVLLAKIIDKYFKKKSAEYAYAESIKYEFSEANYSSSIWLFDHFKKEYPASIYIEKFNNPINDIAKRQQQTLSNRTIFAANNGTKLNTFKDVLTLIKGKTTLIDMWGTWCSPCREEIEKNAKKLRDHFKGKNIVFLYIANYDTGKEKEWRKQIAFFQIEGLHILANPKLTKDIMEKVNANAYPTYIVVKKDGSYKQSVTRYPVNVQAMIKEVEATAL